MSDLGPFPPFSWSHSRRSTFQECPRKYYWQYYGSWTGWEDDATEEARLAYRLKQMTNLHMYVGGVVHELAARAILDVRGGKRRPSAEVLIEAGRRKLNQAYQEAQKRVEWERNPKYRAMLHSFYYGTGPSDRLIGRVKEKLVTCLTNLLRSQSYREALEAPFVEVKDVDRMASFEVNGYEIYAQPDLLYRTGDGGYHLVDWKTGEERETDAEQLRTYGLYVDSRVDLPPSGIEGCLEYLLSGERRNAPITKADLEEQEREVMDGIGAMERYLANPATNEPLPKDAFPLSPDLSICQFCNFYELNEAEIEAVAGEGGPF